MTPATTIPIHRPFTHAQSMALVFCCTMLGAAAQMLMKIGLSHPVQHGLMGYITSLPLLGGYVLYGIEYRADGFCAAGRRAFDSLPDHCPDLCLGHDSFSFVFFHEVAEPFKVLGVAVVVAGWR